MSRWTGPSLRTDLLNSWQYEQVNKAYGSNDPDVLFQGRPQAGTPWPKAAKQKKGQTWNKDLIRETLSAPPVLENVDPRALHATQPNIIRPHVRHYMGGEYEETGKTAADPDNVGNQYPVVYAHPSGRWDILSGHHRAAAALLKGEALRARVIRDQG